MRPSLLRPSLLRPSLLRQSLLRRLLLPALLLTLSAPTHTSAQVPVTTSAAASTTSSATRALRPGDGLRVRIFLEPELSGEFVVDERGIVVLPKLGELDVGNISADSVRPHLITAYKKYLTTDAIEITPFRRVAVTGAVLKPGLYPIDPSMSVGDAIILAGGVAPNGKRNVVELRLAGSDAGTEVASERRLWDSGAGGIRQLYVPPKSWIARNLTTTISVGLSLISAVAIILNASR